MAHGGVQESLLAVHERLVKARREVEIALEQLEVFNDTAEDTKVRALVSDSPLAEREATEARRHEEAMLRSLASARKRVADLEKEQDELLQKLIV